MATVLPAPSRSRKAERAAGLRRVRAEVLATAALGQHLLDHAGLDADPEGVVDAVEEPTQRRAHGELDDLLLAEVPAELGERGLADPIGRGRHLHGVVAHEAVDRG